MGPRCNSRHALRLLQYLAVERGSGSSSAPRHHLSKSQKQNSSPFISIWPEQETNRSLTHELLRAKSFVSDLSSSTNSHQKKSS